MFSAPATDHHETLNVGLLAVGSTALNLTNVNVALNTIVLVGSAIYIWRKVLKKRK